MRVVIRSSPGAAAAEAAAIVAGLLARQPGAALALPTGRTSELLYRALVRRHRGGRLRASRARVFNLDEFAGLAPGDPRSFAAWLDRLLLRHLALRRAQVHLIDGARPWRDAAAAHERAIARAGGLSLAVLGIGVNGHVGFNEPAGSLADATHRERLTAATRQVWGEAFGGRRAVPTHAITMGIGTILRARAVLVLATGRMKAAIVARAVRGPITTRVPASLVRLHPDATIVLDADAAAGLR
jgi:glucosamine-6-phosphate deaminase